MVKLLEPLEPYESLKLAHVSYDPDLYIDRIPIIPRFEDPRILHVPLHVLCFLCFLVYLTRVFFCFFLVLFPSIFTGTFSFDWRYA